MVFGVNTCFAGSISGARREDARNKPHEAQQVLATLTDPHQGL